MHRSRTVFQQAQFGGEPCKGGAIEEVACNETPCAGKFFKILSVSIFAMLINSE